MTPPPSHTVLMLDDGGPRGADMASRAAAFLPGITVSIAAEGTPDRDGVPCVARVPETKLNVRTAVDEAGKRGVFWVALPRDLAEPVDMIVDASARAARYLGPEQPGLAMLFTSPGRLYTKVAAVADVKDTITTGLLAWAAVGMAVRSRAKLDILVLGAEPEDWPEDWREAVAQFPVGPGADILDAAMERGKEAGVEITWVPLGYHADRADAVLQAVREGGYDMVADDLRQIDLGIPLGRKKRVRAMLTEHGNEDTAYALLRDAPCDVIVLLDAVRFGLLPADAVRAGAAGALALGVAGGGVMAMGTAQAAPISSQAVAEAQVDQGKQRTAKKPAPEKRLTEAQKEIKKQKKLEQRAKERLKDARKQLQRAEKKQERALRHVQRDAGALDSTLASTSLTPPAPQAESRGGVADLLANLAGGSDSVLVGEAVTEASQEAVSDEAAQLQAAQAQVHYERSLAGAAAAEQDRARSEIRQAKEDLEAAQQRADRFNRQVSQLEKKLHRKYVPTQNYQLSAYYKQAGPYWSLGYHTGQDFAAPSGTPIFAADDGVVIEAGWGGAYGNYTVIKHGGGITTHYAHQSSQSVSVGQQVSAGQKIGTVGSTGNSTGAHLHFEVRDSSGNFMDPAAWLGS